MKKIYPTSEWVDPRIEIRPRSMAGRGMFACSPIGQGERVMVWGGHVFAAADFEAGRAAPGSTVYIGEETFLGSPPEAYNRERDDRGDFINNSCDPNVWMQDENTLVARREIAAGEELTLDYALFEGDENIPRFVAHVRMHDVPPQTAFSHQAGFLENSRRCGVVNVAHG